MPKWPHGIEPRARFDDCSGTPGHSFRLMAPVGIVSASSTGEVRAAIASVDRSVREGLWAAGFVTYEAAPAFDPAFRVRGRPEGGLPLAWFALFERAEEVEPLDAVPDPLEGHDLSGWEPSVGRKVYEENVERIRGLIAAGETYQVNYTFRLRSGFVGNDLSLYRDLCLAQRSEHCAYLSTGRHGILSASPELFFRIDPGGAGSGSGGHAPFEVVTSRPMKGTIRRGRWAGEDEAAAAALAASKKDRAENAMIVDLIRSDLGRISYPGSVKVPRIFDTERYETVWQMTSTVSSRVAAGTSLDRVLAALFPCGSVTGAPKVRTMEAIAALEDSPRGVYTGAIGWMAPPGARPPGSSGPAPAPRASFNVAIRTVVVDAGDATAEYGVGGGITWDSSPAGEYEECRAKAQVLTARRREMELLETLRWEPGGYVLLERHLQRLAASAAYFGFEHDPAAVRRELEAVASGAGRDEALRVRLTASRDGTVGVKAESLAPEPSRPVRLAVHDEPVDSADVFLFHKTTLRDRYERARAAHPSADDVLLLNERGAVTESTVANVAARIDGRWWTPPLGSGLLPGTCRTELVARGELFERTLMVEDLRRAEELALVSSVRLWRPAVLA